MSDNLPPTTIGRMTFPSSRKTGSYFGPIPKGRSNVAHRHDPILDYSKVEYKLIKMLGKSIHSAQYAVLLQLLHAARTRAGLTQIEMAKKLRTTQSAVSKIERGERRLDIVELHAWCRGLGISFRKFAADLDDRFNSAG